jgi:hypothetical protein
MSKRRVLGGKKPKNMWTRKNKVWRNPFTAVYEEMLRVKQSLESDPNVYTCLNAEKALIIYKETAKAAKEGGTGYGKWLIGLFKEINAILDKLALEP